MSTELTLIYIFGTIGLLDTLYLIYCKVKKKDVWCLFFPQEWCKKVQYSKYSQTMGIPNSIAGFFIYLGVLGATLLYQYNYLPFAVAQTIITIGFAFSIYFLFIQAFVLRAFCTWCVVSAINFTVMFTAMLYIS